MFSKSTNPFCRSAPGLGRGSLGLAMPLKGATFYQMAAYSPRLVGRVAPRAPFCKQGRPANFAARAERRALPRPSFFQSYFWRI
jgi:hypothetical protein